jgi:hypothetical protein
MLLTCNAGTCKYFITRLHVCIYDTTCLSINHFYYSGVAIWRYPEPEIGNARLGTSVADCHAVKRDCQLLRFAGKTPDDSHRP